MQTAPVSKSHALYSPSSAKRWIACKGSTKLIEKAPPQRDNEYSREGTDAHFCLESLLKNPGKRLQTEAFLTKKYGAQMVAHASAAFNKVMSLVPKGAVDLLVETKVDLSFLDKDCSGTLDVAIVELFGTLWIIDYKYGSQIVEPERNEQLILYALGIAHKYDDNFEKVVIAIIQPRAEHDGGTYREWVTDVAELYHWAAIFDQAIEDSKKPDAPLEAGDHCRYCPAGPICPEISTKALKQAQLAFSEDLTQVAYPVPNKVGIAIKNLPTILPALDKIEEWIKKVRDHAFAVAQSGEKIEGFKLVQKRSTRKWTDIDKAEKEAVKAFGAKALTTPELLSPAQLEKAIPEISDKWIEKRVSNISSGTTLVPESDSREAVNIADVFAEIPSQEGKPLKTKKERK